MGVEWVGIAIDCEWAEPMARFYEGLLGFEVRDLAPDGRWAQLFDPSGGVHINIQGEADYEPPIWPEQPGQQAKMMHLRSRWTTLKMRSPVRSNSVAERRPGSPRTAIVIGSA